MAGGSYHLLFVADRNGASAQFDNLQAETNEANNVFAHAITLAAPDLIVPAASAPGNVVLNGTALVNWTVQNLGPGAAPALWYDAIYLSNDAGTLADRNHSDLIRDVPPAYARVPWIEVEARGKERAIDDLRVRLLADAQSPARSA